MNPLRELLSKIPTFDPNNPLKIIWDLLIATMIFILVLVHTIERAFDTAIIPKNFIEGITFLVLIPIVLDSLVTLNSQIYIGGHAVKDRLSILMYCVS